VKGRLLLASLAKLKIYRRREFAQLFNVEGRIPHAWNHDYN